MKNKRVLLIGAIVLIASLLIAGLAMADPLAALTFTDASKAFNLENSAVHTYSFGPEEEIELTATPAAPDEYRLKWTSSDEAIAKFDSTYTTSLNNHIGTKKPGKVTVTVEAVDAKGAALTPAVSARINLEFKEVEVTDVYFSQSELTANSRVYLPDYYTVLPANATYPSITWNIDDTSLAYIEDNFIKFRNNKYGTVTITATAGSKSATLKVDRKYNPITSITVSQKNIKLEVGTGSQRLDDLVTIEPADASGSVKWTSDKPEVAYILEADNFDPSRYFAYPQKAGEATITVASVDDPSIKATFAVTVVENNITGLAFSQKEFKRTMDDSGFYLSSYLDITPADGRGIIRWTSSDITIASVSNNYDDAGWVSVHKPGTVTITAAYENDPTIKAEATVTFEAINATKIAFSQATIELEQGSDDYYYLPNLIQATPANATIKEIAFISSDPDCVSLVEHPEYPSQSFGAGKYIYANKVGTATITATYVNWDGTTVTAPLAVKVVAPKIEGFSFGKTEYKLTTSSKPLDLWRRLVVTPGNRKWQDVFDDDPDHLVWDSSDATIASVDEYGKVTPQGVGTAEITVTYGYDESIAAKATVTVTGTPVRKIALNRSLIEFSPDDTNRSGKLKLTIQPKNADIKEIYWTISNPRIAYIEPDSDAVVANSTSNGIFDTKYVHVYPSGNRKVGTATVTVFVDDGTTVHKATCDVKVAYPAKSWKLKNAKVTLSLIKEKGTDDENNTYDFSDWNKLYNADPDDGDYYPATEMTWKSSKKKVATIDQNGRITVLKTGSTIITGTSKDGNKTTVKCTITVKKYNITSISAEDRTIRVGEVINLLDSCSKGGPWIVLEPKETTRIKIFDPTLTITSSNKDVVSVKNYKLSALKPGKATITVKAKVGKKKITFKVNVVKNVDIDE